MFQHKCVQSCWKSASSVHHLNKVYYSALPSCSPTSLSSEWPVFIFPWPLFRFWSSWVDGIVGDLSIRFLRSTSWDASRSETDQNTKSVFFLLIRNKDKRYEIIWLLPWKHKWWTYALCWLKICVTYLFPPHLQNMLDRKRRHIVISYFVKIRISNSSGLCSLLKHMKSFL